MQYMMMCKPVTNLKISDVLPCKNQFFRLHVNADGMPKNKNGKIDSPMQPIKMNALNAQRDFRIALHQHKSHTYRMSTNP